MTLTIHTPQNFPLLERKNHGELYLIDMFYVTKLDISKRLYHAVSYRDIELWREDYRLFLLLLLFRELYYCRLGRMLK